MSHKKENFEKKISILIQKYEKKEEEIFNLIMNEINKIKKRNFLLIKKNEKLEKIVSYFCPCCGKKIIEREGS